MTQDEILEMARQAGFEIDCCSLEWHKRITAFAKLVAAKAIAKLESQEPVAMLERDPSIGRLRITYEDAVTELDEGVYPLYTTPPQRTWVGLTRDEVLDIEETTKHPLEFYRAIEAKLKEKNT